MRHVIYEAGETEKRATDDRLLEAEGIKPRVASAPEASKPDVRASRPHGPTSNCEIAITSVSTEITRIALRGTLVAGCSAEVVHKTFHSWFQLFKTDRIELNLAELTGIDEAGVSVLANVSSTADALKTEFVINNAPRLVEEAIAARSIDLPGEQRNYVGSIGSV